MHRTRLVLASLMLVALGCSDPPPAPPPPPVPVAKPVQLSPDEIDPTRLMTFPPLPKAMPSLTETTSADEEAGHRLFFAPLGAGISCDSCHSLKQFGVDGVKLEKAPSGSPRRNVPSVYNAAFNGTFGWDGRTTSLEAFLATHIDEESASSKKSAFTPAAIHSLALYLRQLTTPSPWDRFLGGDKNALTAQQKRGFNAFMNTGCAMCHAGVNVGGSLVQKLGLTSPWPGSDVATDLGRFAISKQEGDKHYFRSSPLRNVARTGPYLHDGSVETLDQAVLMMAEHQLGRKLSKDDLADILAFLDALTGVLPPPAIIDAPPK